MTSHAQPEVFRPIDDRIYQLSSQPLAVDKDTVHRTSSYVNAQANGLGTLASPLNTGQQTTFVVNNSSGAKLRWGTMGLAIEMVFHQLGTTGAAVPVIGSDAVNTPTEVHAQPCNAPSWNMTGALIRQVTMKIGGVEIYKSTNGLFCEEFTARLLRNYDYDALNHRDDMLFTPVGSTHYSIGSAADATAVPAIINVFKTVMPANLPHMSTLFLSSPVVGAGVLTYTGYNPMTNPLAQDPLLRERANRWCSGNTHQRVVTKIIPFLDLIPRIADSVMRNLRQFELSIVWENTTDLLEHTAIPGLVANVAARTATHGAVSVTQCYIITDAYAMSPVQAQEVVTEKVGGETDQFMMYSTMATTRPYASGSDIVIPNIRHLDSVMILQRARGFSNAITAPVTAELRTYQSHGEFLMFGNSNNAAATAKLRADEPAASGTAEPIASVQIAYSGTDYPSSPIDIGRAVVAGQVCADFTRLYAEYIKGIARVGRRDVSAAVPYAMFKTTMPFIYLRPFADDAPKLSAEGRDLTIRIRGGSSNATPVNNMCIIIFQLKAFSITPDGVCREIS